MFHRIKYILILFCLTSLWACQKEIQLDYKDAAPKYVIEATLTNSETSVYISKTVDMDATTVTSDISQATVVITDENGNRYDIPYKGEGYYKSDLIGNPDITYHIDVTLDGQHYTSTSTMQREPQLTNIRFIWKEVLSQRNVYAEVRIQDTPNQENYYYIQVLRNGSPYRWIVFNDESNPNKELKQLIALDERGSSAEVQEGDIISFHVRAVDRNAYDYLYSMQRMSDTGTNPISNFTGGCLGYFTAYYQTGIAYVYREAYVEEEDDYKKE